MTNARESTAHLAELLRRERHEMAEFVIALAEFDRQRLWVELGYSGLFAFLHKELGLSKAAAYFRKAAADLVRRYPEVVRPFRDGRLCLTAVVELAKVITPENREDVLPRFFHCSKREAKAVSAALAPDAPPMRAVVTAQVGPSSTGAVRLDEPPSRGSVPALAAVPPPTPVKRDEVEPLTADLRRFHVTVSKHFLEKLEAASAALSHSRPGASAGEILEAGLDVLLERAAKNRGIVEKPRETPRPSAPSHVPAHVSRAVWVRDGGCCQWPLESGGVCGSTLRLELDHIVPLARGGPSTVENLRVLCGFPEVSPRTRSKSRAGTIN